MIESHGDAQLSLLEHGGMQWVHGSGLELRVRESRRARRLILHVIPPGVLEVVVPRGVKAGAVESFVRDHHAWIEAARSELRALPQHTQPALPTAIALPSVGRRFDILYGSHARGRIATDGNDTLVVEHRGEAAHALALLRRWLLGQGRAILKPWLTREAARLGVEPAGTQIRLQRTRWGSCSSQRKISLNAALLLVEPELVRYLLVHELCHLTHMNHSQRYWARVRRFEPDYLSADRRLGRAWRELPLWLFDPGGAGR